MDTDELKKAFDELSAHDRILLREVEIALANVAKNATEKAQDILDAIIADVYS